MMSHFKKLHKQYMSTFLLCLLSQSVFATTGHFYLSGMIDASFAKEGKSDPVILYYTGLLRDAYPLKSNNSTRLELGLNGGYEFIGAGYRPAIALGLGVYTAPTAYTFNGQLIETASGTLPFLLYNYRYNIRSTRAMAEAQLTWFFNNLAPFINVGIGPAWNRLSGYSERAATSDGYVVQPPFRSQTNTNFAYQIGFGIGYMFNFLCQDPNFKKERISLGYRYANLGSVSSGIRDVNYPFHLDTGHFSTNNIYLSYTHLF